MKAQPKGDAPVSREVVEGVRRKMAAPAGPPPAAMLNFNAPKSVNSTRSSQPSQSNRRYDEYDNDYSDNYNDNYDDHDYRDEDEGDDYYSEEERHNRERRNSDSYYEERDYRYDGGGRGDRNEDGSLRNNYTDYNPGYSGKSKNRYDDNDGVMDQRDRDERPNIKPRPVESDSGPSSSSQSKQYNGGGVSGDKASAEAGAKGEMVVVQEAKREVVQGPSGTTSQVVSAYLARSRTTLLSYQPVLRATYRELKHYVTAPCPPGITARCYIERNRSGSKMLAPYYSICADLDDGTGRELMVCRKIMRSRTPHYIFSLKSEDLWRKREQRSRLFLGKLRATGNMDYVLYDNGICDAPEEPESLLLERENGHGDVSADRDTVVSRKMARDRAAAAEAHGAPTASMGTSEDVSLYRSELLAVHFNCKTRPAPNGKRGTEICIPNNFGVDASGRTNILGKPIASAGPSASLPDPKAPPALGVQKSSALYNIVKPFEKVRQEDRQNELYAKSAFVLHERTSKYDPLSSCLVDFKGRANMASVKNCQFVVSDPADPSVAGAEAQMRQDADKDFVLQLGKTTEDCFNMDYRYPLSLLQAFAICIARFDAKLTW